MSDHVKSKVRGPSDIFTLGSKDNLFPIQIINPTPAKLQYTIKYFTDPSFMKVGLIQKKLPIRG